MSEHTYIIVLLKWSHEAHLEDSEGHKQITGKTFTSLNEASEYVRTRIRSIDDIFTGAAKAHDFHEFTYPQGCIGMSAVIAAKECELHRVELRVERQEVKDNPMVTGSAEIERSEEYKWQGGFVEEDFPGSYSHGFKRPR